MAQLNTIRVLFRGATPLNDLRCKMSRKLRTTRVLELYYVIREAERSLITGLEGELAWQKTCEYYRGDRKDRVTSIRDTIKQTACQCASDLPAERFGYHVHCMPIRLLKIMFYRPRRYIGFECIEICFLLQTLNHILALIEMPSPPINSLRRVVGDCVTAEWVVERRLPGDPHFAKKQAIPNVIYNGPDRLDLETFLAIGSSRRA